MSSLETETTTATMPPVDTSEAAKEEPQTEDPQPQEQEQEQLETPQEPQTTAKEDNTSEVVSAMEGVEVEVPKTANAQTNAAAAAAACCAATDHDSPATISASESESGSESENESESTSSDQEMESSSGEDTSTTKDIETTSATQEEEEPQPQQQTPEEVVSAPQEQEPPQQQQVVVEEEEDLLLDVKQLISEGLTEMSTSERTRIAEEVHGVKHMGLSAEEEMRVGHVFLKQFQDVLDGVLTSKLLTPPESCDEDSDDSESPSPSSPELDLELEESFPIAAYERCLEKDFSYATHEAGELRVMCLRAELWDPSRACSRFLKHLTVLHKYYGDAGLMQPLTIDRLDYEERHRNNKKNRQAEAKKAAKAASKKAAAANKGAKTTEAAAPPPPPKPKVYKKGKGGSKRKGSLDSLPDMMALKSGTIQVLPSRDRSGRKVVVLQPCPSFATSQQTQLQVQHSKLKAMLYFFSVLSRRDMEAQRKGFVLIINSTKTEDRHNEETYNSDLLDQYKDLYESIPIRFSALHFAYDKNSQNSVSHKICKTILQSYINLETTTNIARISLYDQDMSNDSVRNKAASFGIPTHQIPLTHTGTIKLKEHNGWVKIQAWYDNCSSNHSAYNILNSSIVIECPGTNDVLFSQGGKYWNGVNRFQRGNLEFMEFLESKIDIYQATLSWKKKHTILQEVVAEFANSPQSNGNGNGNGAPPRFLETATQIEGVTAPDGCWVELPLTSPLLMQKIRQTLLNHIRRLEASGKRQPPPKKAKKETNEDGTPVASTKKQKKQKRSTKDGETTTTTTPSKKRKLSSSVIKPPLVKVISKPTSRSGSQSPHVMMKNNKLAMATFGNSIAGSNMSGSSSSSVSFSSSEADSLLRKQSICEFLANAERIAVSTAAVEIACSKNNHHNGCDDSSDSLSQSSSNCENNTLQDSIANDEKLVQAIIANDDRLNKEVGELFELDSFLKDECSSDDDDDLMDACNRDEIADCLMGCML